MRDLISREDAIKAMCYACGHECTEEEMQTCPEHYELTHMSSAEPERKTGKWKRAYLDREAMGERPSIFYCSVCNQCIAYPVNYCPSCGADMRGDSDE